jgi:hypothetical protein
VRRAIPLFETRPVVAKALLVFAGPILFGLLCGFLLGHSKTAYLLASLLTIPGAFLAGYEHAGASDGADRGVIGGALFGEFILVGHYIDGSAAMASLPHPAGVLVVFTALIGTLLGAFGGYVRGIAEARAPAA